MIQTTSSGPVNRHITEYLTDNLRVKQYKCKTLQNPDYYYDGSNFGAVDVGHKLDTSTDKAGGIWLRDKGIVSVGTKKSDDDIQSAPGAPGRESLTVVLRIE